MLNEFSNEIPFILIFVLVSVMFIDYITGILRALYTKRVNSKVHYKGVIKKVGLLIGVLFTALVDLVISEGKPIFTELILLLFIAGEGLSIVENLGVIGVKIPTALKERLTQLNSDENFNNKLEEKEKEKEKENNSKGGD